jgi:hypothetical protein
MLMAAAFLALQAACQQAENPDQELGSAAGSDAEPQAQKNNEALAQAESDFQTALRRCDMLATEQQSGCREDAHAMLEAARRAVEGPPGPS